MIYNGDSIKITEELKSDSIDSLVTDPPAGIGFMGKDWDKSEAFETMESVFKEAFRVLKPGAHGLVWAIPRTSHKTATILENVGFEIRDVITHLFGSGFPKSLDVSKAIDKMCGAEREIIGSKKADDIRGGGLNHRDCNGDTKTHIINITAPATPDAKQWEGWGTALKPASEHWILIRKPLGEKTVAKNVLKHGTGALNIDASRVSTNGKVVWRMGDRPPDDSIYVYKEKPGNGSDSMFKNKGNRKGTPQGRFPANLILSHNEDCEETCTEGCAVKMLDEQSGVLKTNPGKYKEDKNKAGNIILEKENKQGYVCSLGSIGGASRFFYCAKASKRDRNGGLEGMPLVRSGMMEDDNYPIKTGSGNLRDTKNQNFHPTVKSTKLMEYLIRLITPPNGTVLDPFMGSGSTGVAAKRLGFHFIGIEKEKEYFDIAKARIEKLSGEISGSDDQKL